MGSEELLRSYSLDNSSEIRNRPWTVRLRHIIADLPGKDFSGKSQNGWLCRDGWCFVFCLRTARKAKCFTMENRSWKHHFSSSATKQPLSGLQIASQRWTLRSLTATPSSTDIVCAENLSRQCTGCNVTVPNETCRWMRLTIWGIDSWADSTTWS